MPPQIHGTKIQESNQNLKLAFSILANEKTFLPPNNSKVSLVYVIGHFVEARFKFTLHRTFELEVSPSFKIHNLHKDSITQTKVTCYVNDKAKYLICPHIWSDFIDMGRQRCVGRSSCEPCKSCYTYMYSVIIDIIVDISIPFIPSPWTISSHSDDRFTDFYLGSENGSVPVHRVVMAAHSEVFKTMLNGEWKETAKGCLEVKGVTQETLHHLKDYMYLGSLPEHVDLRLLLLVAKCYMMHHLEEACADRLAQTVTSENFQGVLEFAVDNRLFALISSIVKNTSTAVVEASEAIKKELKLKAVEE